MGTLIQDLRYGLRMLRKSRLHRSRNLHARSRNPREYRNFFLSSTPFRCSRHRIRIRAACLAARSEPETGNHRRRDVPSQPA